MLCQGDWPKTFKSPMMIVGLECMAMQDTNYYIGGDI